MTGAPEEFVLAPARRFRVRDGALVGLVAAVSSTLILLFAGAVSGDGWHILTDAGMAGIPSAVHAATGIPAAASYLLSHTLIYLIAGVAALALAGLADRLPPVVAGLILLAIIIEFGFMVFTTESQAGGHIGLVTWRSLLVAHVIGDAVLVLGIVRAHPTLRHAFVQGYEW